MKKLLLFSCIVVMLDSCCSKQETCKCSPLIMNFMFDCYTEKELSDFQIIKYDSATGKLISSEKIHFIRPKFGGAQYNINLDTDAKYDIEFANKPLGISRRFTDFKFFMEDAPKPCYDCKTKMRYKTCKEMSRITFLVNEQPVNSGDTNFESIYKNNCRPGYLN